MSSRLPTGSDVARLAGVSKSAVSRAYTGGLVSAEARTRIQEAARILKYRPSQTARSLTTSQSKLVGVAVTHLDNQFYPEVIERLAVRLAQSGFRIVLFITHGEADLDPVLDELLGYRLDGVILASSSMASRVAAECRDARVPVVMFNNVDPAEQVPGVTTDNRAGAATIARYLIAAGHRRFGLIAGAAASTTSTEREAAFQSALAAAGLDRALVETCDYSFERAQRATRALLRSSRPPDALFYVNDHMALAGLQIVRELGLVPGADISIVGFDNVAVSAWPIFALTTFAQPVAAMVDAAVLGLVEAIAGKEQAAATTRLPGRLIVRGSSRIAPGTGPDHDGNTVWPAA